MGSYVVPDVVITASSCETHEGPTTLETTMSGVTGVVSLQVFWSLQIRVFSPRVTWQTLTMRPEPYWGFSGPLWNCRLLSDHLYYNFETSEIYCLFFFSCNADLNQIIYIFNGHLWAEQRGTLCKPLHYSDPAWDFNITRQYVSCICFHVTFFERRTFYFTLVE